MPYLTYSRGIAVIWITLCAHHPCKGVDILRGIWRGILKTQCKWKDKWKAPHRENSLLPAFQHILPWGSLIMLFYTLCHESERQFCSFKANSGAGIKIFCFIAHLMLFFPCCQDDEGKCCSFKVTVLWKSHLVVNILLTHTQVMLLTHPILIFVATA
jgi:hypothetical protein